MKASTSLELTVLIKNVLVRAAPEDAMKLIWLPMNA